MNLSTGTTRCVGRVILSPAMYLPQCAGGQPALTHDDGDSGEYAIHPTHTENRGSVLSASTVAICGRLFVGLDVCRRTKTMYIHLRRQRLMRQPHHRRYHPLLDQRHRMHRREGAHSQHPKLPSKCRPRGLSNATHSVKLWTDTLLLCYRIAVKHSIAKLVKHGGVVSFVGRPTCTFTKPKRTAHAREMRCKVANFNSPLCWNTVLGPLHLLIDVESQPFHCWRRLSGGPLSWPHSPSDGRRMQYRYLLRPCHCKASTGASIEQPCRSRQHSSRLSQSAPGGAFCERRRAQRGPLSVHNARVRAI